MDTENSGEDRRQPESQTGFGLAPIRKEGGWNYDITRGGGERRKDHPNYFGYWEKLDAPGS